MRTFFTALTFLVILMAVIPAVKRSISPPRDTEAGPRHDPDNLER